LPNIRPGPSVSSMSNSVSLGARSNSHGNRYGLRNLKCNSISDVIPQAGSLTESKANRRDVKKRSPEGESSSSSRGKRSSETSYEAGCVPLSTTGISISCPRQIRNLSSNNYSSTASTRNRRSLNATPLKRLLNFGNFSRVEELKHRYKMLVNGRLDFFKGRLVIIKN
jgi:hypothetical protein